MPVDEPEYRHPETSELLPRSDIGALPNNQQVQLVLDWFRENFSESEYTPSPDPGFPSDPSAIDPRDELGAEFGRDVSADVLSRVEQALAADHVEWVPRKA